jgi:hypothetical protein
MNFRAQVVVGVLLVTSPFLIAQAQSVVNAEGAVSPIASTTATSSAVDLLSTMTVATSSVDLPSGIASSSPAADPPAKLYEEPFVLQPAINFDVRGNTISANIALENLTCRSCEKVLPDLDVVAYYTAWYPNDGDFKEVGVHFGEQSFTMASLAKWTKRDISWTAEAVPGNYYFVVVIDPQNTNGAYRLYRSEFSI